MLYEMSDISDIVYSSFILFVVSDDILRRQPVPDCCVQYALKLLIRACALRRWDMRRSGQHVGVEYVQNAFVFVFGTCVERARRW